MEGPDFQNAHIKIGDLEWYGSVEFHLKASDWYAHQHQLDAAYNNVILHLVWEDDVTVFTQAGVEVYTLSIKSWINEQEQKAYDEFFRNNKDGIVCTDRFAFVDPLIRLGWKERLFVGRLERRVEEIEKHLAIAKQDWEAVFFWHLAKGFGLNQNGSAFFETAQSLPFSIVRKCSHDIEALEALFMGQAGLLEKTLSDPYFQKLKKIYSYLKHKFKLKRTGISLPHFARIRPPNFPTIRWAQVAQVYAKHQSLFTGLMQKNAHEELLTWKTLNESPYWEEHYNFGKLSPKRTKRVTLGFIQLLEINVVLPFYYFYNRAKGRILSEEVLTRMSQLPPEKNSITHYFESIGAKVESALDTQAHISMKKEYCDVKKCLLCSVGQSLLQQKNGPT